jgi:hypothetical protein
LKDSLQLSDAQSIDMANEFRAKCSNVLFLPEFGLKAGIQHQWYEVQSGSVVQHVPSPW